MQVLGAVLEDFLHRSKFGPGVIYKAHFKSANTVSDEYRL